MSNARNLGNSSSRSQDVPCEHRFCVYVSTGLWFIGKLLKRHSANIAASLFMVTGLFMNVLMLALTHERVPISVNTLPDLVFDFVPYYYNAFTFSEIFIATQNISFFLLVIFHPEREMIIRRFLFIMGIVYFSRTVTFSSTQLPTPFDPNVCFVKLHSNLTMSGYLKVVAKRVVQFAGTGGFVSKEKHILCGDYIFSGHTHIILIVYLFINTYFFMNKQRNKFCLTILENLHFCLASAAVVCVLISRQHYTIDVVLSYYITTRVFWTYHSLCLEKHMFQELRYRYENELCVSFSEEPTGGKDDQEAAGASTAQQQVVVMEKSVPILRNDPNLLSQVWWWPLFIYMEINKKPHTSLDPAEKKKKSSRLNICFALCTCTYAEDFSQEIV